MRTDATRSYHELKTFYSSCASPWHLSRTTSVCSVATIIEAKESLSISKNRAAPSQPHSTLSSSRFLKNRHIMANTPQRYHDRFDACTRYLTTTLDKCGINDPVLEVISPSRCLFTGRIEGERVFAVVNYPNSAKISNDDIFKWLGLKEKRFFKKPRRLVRDQIDVDYCYLNAAVFDVKKSFKPLFRKPRDINTRYLFATQFLKSITYLLCNKLTTVNLDKDALFTRNNHSLCLLPTQVSTKCPTGRSSNEQALYSWLLIEMLVEINNLLDAKNYEDLSPITKNDWTQLSISDKAYRLNDVLTREGFPYNQCIEMTEVILNLQCGRDDIHWHIIFPPPLYELSEEDWRIETYQTFTQPLNTA